MIIINNLFRCFCVLLFSFLLGSFIITFDAVHVESVLWNGNRTVNRRCIRENHRFSSLSIFLNVCHSWNKTIGQSVNRNDTRGSEWMSEWVSVFVDSLAELPDWFAASISQKTFLYTQNNNSNNDDANKSQENKRCRETVNVRTWIIQFCNFLCRNYADKSR